MPTLHVEGHPVAEGDAGATLLEICEAHGIPMDSACGGFAACNSCRVVVLEGMGALSATQPEESAFLDHDGQRLGCQARLLGPAAVRLDPGM